MRRLLFFAAALAVFACSEDTTRTYDNDTLSLLVVHTAKDACTCRYVMGRDDTYCITYTKADPDIAAWTADDSKKTVSASVLVGWTAKAHFVDDHFGCAIDQ